MSLSSESWRYNADGFLLTSKETTDKGRSYLQIFKDGSLEYGDSYVLGSNSRGSIPSGILEQKLVATFEQALSLLKSLEVSPPIYVTLTLIGVKGTKLATPYYADGYKSDLIDRDVVVCPDVEVQHVTEERPYPTTLLPIVNSVWQAAGIAQSLNIKQGQWVVESTELPSGVGVGCKGLIDPDTTRIETLRGPLHFLQGLRIVDLVGLPL